MVVALPEHHVDGAEREFPQLGLIGDEAGEAAVRLSGLSARAAMVVNLGVEHATRYGWPEPQPVAAALSSRRQRAKQFTNELQAPLYDTLTGRQRTEFAQLVDALTASKASAHALSPQ
ncbi:hypothetical protein ACF059_30760 [Streptomyces sp. NPDC016562]|uniref:hypothetical protein n=1 Tax=Streptomyces sp. NPDC016562 TaxID=3364966 RepID=UPI0036F8286A